MNNKLGWQGIFKEKCKEHNLKVTPQRTVIYGELLNVKDHPTVDEVFKSVKKVLPNISFDTIYRTLQSFAEIGAIDVVEGYGGSKRFDIDTKNHHHMHCVKCGSIIDFYSEAYDKIKIPKNIKKQFNVIKKKVILEGVCSLCA